MMYRLIETPAAEPVEASVAYSQVIAGPYDLGGAGCDSFSCVADLDVDTPAAVIVASASIVFGTGVWTSAAHGFGTGLKVQIATSNTLPDPLLVLTDYYIISVSANTFKIAASLADAIAGTAITLTNAGVGNQTVTPVSIAGGSIKLEQANHEDGPWVICGSATNVTADADVLLEKDRPTTRYMRVYLVLTAGNVSTSLQVLAKGDRA